MIIRPISAIKISQLCKFYTGKEREGLTDPRLDMQRRCVRTIPVMMAVVVELVARLFFSLFPPTSNWLSALDGKPIDHQQMRYRQDSALKSPRNQITLKLQLLPINT